MTFVLGLVIGISAGFVVGIVAGIVAYAAFVAGGRADRDSDAALVHMLPTTLCLCCGATTPIDRDCPNVEDGMHSTERAVAVAQYLQAIDINHPSSEQVRNAILKL